MSHCSNNYVGILFSLMCPYSVCRFSVFGLFAIIICWLLSSLYLVIAVVSLTHLVITYTNMYKQYGTCNKFVLLD